MRKRTLRQSLTVIISAILLTVAIMPGGTALAGGPIGARAMLIAYYDLINSGNYWTAYQQWASPPQTYADFVAGYADTTHITAYFGGLQATSADRFEGCISGILIGQHTNGSTVAYQGSYDLHYNPAQSGIGQWTILAGQFVPLPTVPTDPYQILHYDLAGTCVEHGSGIEPPPTLMLTDYINAVNRGAFEIAYGYWLHPAGIAYTPPQTYADFVNGWNQTAETVLFYGQPQYRNTASTPGVASEALRVPVVILGYHTDGSLVVAAGCIGMSHYAVANPMQEDPWRLYASYVQPVALPSLPSAQFMQSIFTTECYAP